MIFSLLLHKSMINFIIQSSGERQIIFIQKNKTLCHKRIDYIFQTQKKLSIHLLLQPPQSRCIKCSSNIKGKCLINLSAQWPPNLQDFHTNCISLCTFETLLIPINVFTLTSLLCTVILHALHYWMKKNLYIWQDFCSTKVTVTFVGQSLSICQCLCLIHQLSLH